MQEIRRTTTLESCFNEKLKTRTRPHEPCQASLLFLGRAGSTKNKSLQNDFFFKDKFKYI